MPHPVEAECALREDRAGSSNEFPSIRAAAFVLITQVLAIIHIRNPVELACRPSRSGVGETRRDKNIAIYFIYKSMQIFKIIKFLREQIVMNISKRELLKRIVLSILAASSLPGLTNAAAKDADAAIPLIPTPHRIRNLGGKFRIESGAQITYDDPVIENNIRIFTEALRPFSEIKLKSARRSSANSPKGAIHLEIGPTPETGDVPQSTGLSPADHDDLDERYFLRADKTGVVIKARSAQGLVMGLTTLLQIIITAPQQNASAIEIPSVRIVDGPHFKWRSFHLDVARHYFTTDEIKTVIDLIAFYKFNALDLHLTDDEAWRIEAARPEGKQPDDEPIYSRADLNEIIAYAQARHITVIPSSDAPGHAAALIRLHPELAMGSNVQRFELMPGVVQHRAWLNLDLPASFKVYDEIIAYLSDVFPGRWLDIGGDEAFGMPEALYTKFVRHQHKAALLAGKMPLACQETMRAGLDRDIVVQHWISTDLRYANMQLGTQMGSQQAIELQKLVVKNVEQSINDMKRAMELELPILLTPFAQSYLDVPYKEDSVQAEQNALKVRLGMRAYQPQTIEEYYDWNPGKSLPGEGKGAHIAGVGAAIWCEMIKSFDDLTFLILPRLPGMAQKGWSTISNSPWSRQSTVLPAHGKVWQKSGLSFFKSELVKW
ncbi:MAG: beta-N-acetylhexosaminidase [Candidatus Ochrobactrum gambitense]|nr:MAG: beta-N-acetylhexosaminidase [Candidatus Ochrobactrum gambitense]WEK16593.1 MAG: family 20 glycosylhydrolase [Candidatus Ochrobactrum gambitense]